MKLRSNYGSDVTTVECPQSGHAPFIDEGELYHRSLLDFLSARLGG